jgi:16S rRNA processing protein RimM
MDVVVARIGKPHSLHGEVTVQLHTDDPLSRFVPGATFATQATPGTGVPPTLTLRSARLHNGTWLLGFEQVPDRTGAQALRGTRLVLDIEAEAVPEPDEPGGAWFEDELTGLAVITREGTRVGEVSGLEIGPAQDLLVLALDAGGTAYVPFVSALVPHVDVDEGVVVIDPPEGLLELNS